MTLYKLEDFSPNYQQKAFVGINYQIINARETLRPEELDLDSKG